MFAWLQNKIKNNLFIKFFLSFLLVLLIPATGIFAAIYLTVVHVTREELTTLNIKIMDNVRNTIDSYMSTLNTAVYQSSTDASLAKLVAHTDENPGETAYAVRNILTALQAITAQEGVFFLMAMYIPERDLIISPRSSYSRDEFYKFYCNFQDMSIEDWDNFVRDTSLSRFLPAREIQSSTDGKHNVITYVHAIPFNYNKPKAFFIALIDTDQVQKLLDSDSALKGHFKITDRQGQTLMNSQDFPLSLDTAGTDAFYYDTHSEVMSGGQKFIGIYNKGTSVNWNYMYFIPESTILGKLPYIQMTSAAVFIACLMLGVLLAYKQSSHHYAPLKGILNFIRANVSDGNNTSKGEYSIISDTLHDVFVKNTQFKHELQSQFSILKSNFLEKLLYESHLYNDIEISELLGYYKIEFNKPFFQVAVMSFTDIAGFEGSAAGENEGYNPAGMLQTADRFFFEKGCSIHVAGLNGQKLAFLANFDGTGNDEFINAITQLQELLRTKLEGSIHVGVSGVYQGIGNINKCCREAAIALNSGQKSELEKLIYYRDAISGVSNIYYPLEKEIQIINNIKAGNFDGVRSLLSEIRDINFHERQLPSEMRSCVFNNMVSTALKAYDEVRTDNSEFINDSIKALYISNKAFESEDSLNHILDLYYRLCSFASQKMKGKNQRTIAHVIEYIKENYSDSSLSLVSISDRFNISYYYLSRMFKEETGSNFADYLNLYRMEKAQEFLSGGKVSIQNIAACVGYTNPNTFIRAFKKQYNITPGQFRKGTDN